jgi:hypothetical protein
MIEFVAPQISERPGDVAKAREQTLQKRHPSQTDSMKSTDFASKGHNACFDKGQ